MTVAQERSRGSQSAARETGKRGPRASQLIFPDVIAATSRPNDDLHTAIYSGSIGTFGMVRGRSASRESCAWNQGRYWQISGGTMMVIVREGYQANITISVDKDDGRLSVIPQVF